MDLEGLWEVLPELMNGGGEPSHAGTDGDDGLGAPPLVLAGESAETVARENGRHPIVAVCVVPTIPVGAAARVLVDLEPASRLDKRLPRPGRPQGCRLTSPSERKTEREVPDKHRSGVAEVPEVSRMPGPAGVSNGQREPHRRAAGEERESGDELTDLPRARGVREDAFEPHRRPDRSRRLDGQPVHARLVLPSRCVLEAPTACAGVYELLTTDADGHASRLFPGHDGETRRARVDEHAVGAGRERDRGVRKSRGLADDQRVLGGGAGAYIGLEVQERPPDGVVGPTGEDTHLERRRLASGRPKRQRSGIPNEATREGEAQGDWLAASLTAGRLRDHKRNKRGHGCALPQGTRGADIGGPGRSAMNGPMASTSRPPSLKARTASSGVQTMGSSCML